jgi:hypothetical protein
MLPPLFRIALYMRVAPYQIAPDYARVGRGTSKRGVDVSEATGSGTFAVRASAAERAAWRRQAELLGQTRNDWIRHVLNAASGGLRPGEVTATKDERRALLASVLPGRWWEADEG